MFSRAKEIFEKKFELVSFSTCEKCGSINESDAKFCIFCGVELNHPLRQKLNYI